MEIQVKIIKVLETQSFTSQKTGNVYVKNVFVGATQGQYPKNIAFAVMGEEKFAQMGIVIGGTYNVSFDVESREWRGRLFTEASAWKAVRIDGEQGQQQTQAPQQAPQQQVHEPQQRETSENLPF